jgi:hypothetical protein
VLNLFFIPALYVILQTLLGVFSRKKHKGPTPPAPAPAI